MQFTSTNYQLAHLPYKTRVPLSDKNKNYVERYKTKLNREVTRHQTHIPALHITLLRYIIIIRSEKRGREAVASTSKRKKKKK